MQHLRVEAISDTHGETKSVKVNSCDILLHAGDVIVDGWKREWMRHRPGLSVEWMMDVWLPWIRPMIEGGHVGQVVLTWGNHDWTMGAVGQELKERLKPFKIHVLVDEEVNVGGLRIWGTPWSNTFMNWSWMQPPEKLKTVYDQVPAGVDIIVSHQPPLGAGGRFLDLEIGKIVELGSAHLLDTVRRVKPKAVVCGHIHGGYGEYRVDNSRVYNTSVADEAYNIVRGSTKINLARLVGEADGG